MGFVVYPYQKTDLFKDSGFDVKWVLLFLTIAGVVLTELGIITAKVNIDETHFGGKAVDNDADDGDDETDKLVYRGYAGNRKRSVKFDVGAIRSSSRRRPQDDSQTTDGVPKWGDADDVTGRRTPTADDDDDDDNGHRRQGEDGHRRKTTIVQRTGDARRRRREAEESNAWDPDKTERNGRRRYGWGHAEMTLIHICLHGFITQVACIILTYLRNDMHILTEILLVIGNLIIALAATIMLVISLLNYQDVAGAKGPPPEDSLYFNVETNTIVLIVILILLIVAMMADVGFNVRRMQLDANNRPRLD